MLNFWQTMFPSDVKKAPKTHVKSQPAPFGGGEKSFPHVQGLHQRLAYKPGAGVSLRFYVYRTRYPK